MTIVRQRDHSGEGHRWLPDYLNQIPPKQKFKNWRRKVGFFLTGEFLPEVSQDWD